MKPAHSAVPVMILNWNGWDNTFQCLRSLADCSDVNEIWLIDNGSDEDRSGAARAICPNLRVLRLDDNYGWTGGYNRALRVASDEGYEYAYLLNNDCQVDRHFLSATLAIAEADPGIGAVGSRIADTDSPAHVVFDGSWHLDSPPVLKESNGVRTVDDVHGAGMLVSLAAISEHGYFDERFFCYVEEREWCRRVRTGGRTIVVADASVVYHADAASDFNRNREYYLHRNAFLLDDLNPDQNKRKGRIRLAYESLRESNEVRRTTEIERAITMAHGVVDGVRRRWGRRGPPPPRLLLLMLIHSWPFPQGLVRNKFRSQKPGLR